MRNGIIIFLLICMVGGYIFYTDREKIHEIESKSLSDYYGYKDPEYVAETNARYGKESADHEALRLKDREATVVLGTIFIGLVLGTIVAALSEQKRE